MKSPLQQLGNNLNQIITCVFKIDSILKPLMKKSLKTKNKLIVHFSVANSHLASSAPLITGVRQRHRDVPGPAAPAPGWHIRQFTTLDLNCFIKTST